MNKKSVIISVLLGLLASAVVFAQDEDVYLDDPIESARKAHELAASDVIYQQQDLKALYYQNLQIVQLLEQIRDSLDVIKVRGGIKIEEKKA